MKPHIHAAVAGRCCDGESAQDVLQRLRQNAPRQNKGEPSASFAQRQQAWKNACAREEERVRNPPPPKPTAEEISENVAHTFGVPGGAVPQGVIGADGRGIKGVVIPDPEPVMEGVPMPKKKRASSKTGRVIFEVRLTKEAVKGQGVPKGSEWHVKRRADRMVIGYESTQVKAIKHATALAKEQMGPAQVVTYDKQGRIQNESTFGADPKRRKG